MVTRTTFPDTKGAWVSPNAFPLLEILSDGSGINVHSRPTGFDFPHQLANDGERAAFTYEQECYFSGPSSAVHFQADMWVAWSPIARFEHAPASFVEYWDKVDATRATNKAAYLLALRTGKYATPIPTAPEPIAQPVNVDGFAP